MQKTKIGLAIAAALGVIPSFLTATAEAVEPARISLAGVNIDLNRIKDQLVTGTVRPEAINSAITNLTTFIDRLTSLEDFTGGIDDQLSAFQATELIDVLTHYGAEAVRTGILTQQQIDRLVGDMKNHGAKQGFSSIVTNTIVTMKNQATQIRATIVDNFVTGDKATRVATFAPAEATSMYAQLSTPQHQLNGAWSRSYSLTQGFLAIADALVVQESAVNLEQRKRA